MANGLAPVFVKYLESTDHRVPDALTRHHRSLGIRVAVNRHEMARILDRLSQLNIDAVVLKGEPLARELFGDPHARSTTDLDVLVAPADFWKAAHLLEDDAYSRSSSYKPWAYNQVAFHRETPTVDVELHWQIAFPAIPTPETDQLIRRRRHVENDGVKIPVLDEDSTFLQLCYHFHQHHGFLKGLLDIAAYLDRNPDVLTNPRFYETVDRLGLRGLVAWPLTTLSYFVADLNVPERFAPDFAVQLLAEWTTRRIVKRYRSLENPLYEVLPDALQKVWGTATDCLTMGVLDESTRKFRHGLKPLFLGPHRLGRLTGPVLQPLYDIDDPGPEPDRPSS